MASLLLPYCILAWMAGCVDGNWLSSIMRGAYRTVAKVPELVTVVSTDCSSYQAWQVTALALSWKQSGIPGNFVRLLACPREQWGVYDDTLLDVDQRITTYTHELGHPTYSPLNRPYGLMQWLFNGSGRAVSADAVILIVDPDMVFQRDAVQEAIPKLMTEVAFGDVGAIGTDFEYTVDGMRATNWSLPRHFNIPPDTQLQSLGVPLLLRKDRLLQIVPGYYNITLEIVQDPALHEQVHDGNQPAPWIAEMYGYTLAAAKLPHQTQNEWPVLAAPQPPFIGQAIKPLVVHYSHKFHLCHRPFGKTMYYNTNPLNCSISESTLAGLRPPPREIAVSDSCKLCIEKGDIIGWPSTCFDDVKDKHFSLLAWEQVYQAVDEWRSVHCR